MDAETTKVAQPAIQAQSILKAEKPRRHHQPGGTISRQAQSIREADTTIVAEPTIQAQSAMVTETTMTAQTTLAAQSTMQVQ